MNPYTYSRGRKGKAGNQKSGAWLKLRSFVSSIFNAEVSTVTAMALVLFAASSVAAIAMVAQAELSDNSDVVASRVSAYSVANSSRVLGTATYGYNQPVCGNNVCLSYQIVDFSAAAGTYNARIGYFAQNPSKKISGSLKVNGNLFKYNIRGDGDTFTGYNLKPNTFYKFSFYSGLSGSGRILNTLSFSTPDRQPIQPVCPAMDAAPSNGCYYQYDNNGCYASTVCPQPSYGYGIPSQVTQPSVFGTNPSSNIRYVTVGQSNMPILSFRVFAGPSQSLTLRGFDLGIKTFPDGRSVDGLVSALIVKQIDNPSVSTNISTVLSGMQAEATFKGGNGPTIPAGGSLEFAVYADFSSNMTPGQLGVTLKRVLNSTGSTLQGEGIVNGVVQVSAVPLPPVYKGKTSFSISSSGSIVAGNTNSDLLKVAVAVSGNNINLSSVSLQLAGNMGKPVSNMKLYDLYGSLLASAQNVSILNDGDTTQYDFVFKAQTIMNGQTAIYYVRGDVSSAAAGSYQVRVVGTSGTENTNIEWGGASTLNIIAVPSSGARAGQLVNKTDKTVYLVGANVLYPIPSLAVFNSWGWSFASVVPANSTEAYLPVSNTWVPSRNPNCSSPLDQIAGACGIVQANVSASPTTLSFNSSGDSVPQAQAIIISGGGSAVNGINPLIVQVSSGSLSWLGVTAYNQGVGTSLTTIPGNSVLYVSVKVPAGTLPGTVFTGAIQINNTNSSFRAVAITIPVTFTFGRQIIDSPRVGIIINNNGTVQLVGKTGLYGFPDLATFNSWGFSFSNVVVANSAESAMSQVGVVPMKKDGCNNPLDQINGSCGSVSVAPSLEKNSSFSNQAVNPNQTKVRIGSYVISAGNIDGVVISKLTLSFVPTTDVVTNPATSFSNLYLTTPLGNTSPVNPSYSNDFSAGFSILRGQTATIDVYADVSNTSGSYKTALSASGSGYASFQAVNLASQPGQVITVNSSNYAPLSGTLSGSSPVSQNVVGGTMSQPIAVYHLVSGNTATVQEMTFSVTGTSAYPISAITVAGNKAVMINGTAIVNGLNISVPASYSGVDVPVLADYVSVGINGAPAGTTFILNLVKVKYLINNTAQSATVNVPARQMTLVGSNDSTSPVLSMSLDQASPPAKTIPAGSNSVEVARVVLRASGEDISVGSMTVYSNVGNLANCIFTNVQLIDASTGSQIGQTVANPTAAGTCSANFVGIYWVVPRDSSKSISVRLSIPGSAPAASFSPVVMISFLPVTASGKLVNIPNEVTGSVMTVSSANSTPRVGFVINNSGTVQFVGKTGLYGFPDLTTFNSWGFSFSNVVPANSTEIALSQVGVVPMKKDGCSNLLDQIAGVCGVSSTAPAITSFAEYPAVIKVGESYQAVFGGQNISASTYFDVLYEYTAPGATAVTERGEVDNWQQGPTQSHTPTLAPPGTWVITGARAHNDANMHSGAFTTVRATVQITQ